MSAPTSASSDDSRHRFVESLNVDAVRSIANTAYHKCFPASSGLLCSVVEPCTHGGYNVVYEVRFSDGTKWAIRIPFPDQQSNVRRNIMGHLFVASRTSVPIPKIRDFSLSSNNALGQPYTIMDFVQGRNLVDVWYDQSWWTGDRSKARTLASLAQHMVHLASIEFSEIGALECDGETGDYYIAPFSSRLELCPLASGPDSPLGPFGTQRDYLRALLDSAQGQLRTPEFAFLGLFAATLLEPRYDAVPFTLCHPDLDCWNVFVDESTGDVTALIDWDGLAAVPQQLGALTYPAWLTRDWNPSGYNKESVVYEHADDLHNYRTIYVDAVRKYGGDTCADITRNSHIPAAIQLALRSLHSMSDIVYQLGKLYFGSAKLVLDMCVAAHQAGWQKRDPGEIIQMPEFITWTELFPDDDQDDEAALTDEDSNLPAAGEQSEPRDSAP
ncbi:kinase-like protein [Exidia glandulosa HHB12029]|uniref:Kinase-like protein n=1 Tax=Exidia glandulosa HHB12029 TaxID=1314781 RepID=A0A165J1A1_EXIGL|nr:kinase-like protein [Exidia glandulosa HHB12029]